MTKINHGLLVKLDQGYQSAGAEITDFSPIKTVKILLQLLFLSINHCFKDGFRLMLNINRLLPHNFIMQG